MANHDKGDHEELRAALAGDEPRATDDALADALSSLASEVPPVDELTWMRLRRTISKGPWWRTASVAPWHLAASVAAAVALSIQVPAMVRAGDAEPAFYETVGEEAAATYLAVTFTPDAREAQIRRLLLNADLTITEGPSALGIYQLRMKSNGDLSAARQTLLALNESVVESAEVREP